jgi:uncharacterized protein YbjT (DUF2867 family)
VTLPAQRPGPTPALAGRPAAHPARAHLGDRPFAAGTRAPVAVVAGASGQLGAHVVDELLGRGWRVRALTRDAGAYTAGYARRHAARPGGGAPRRPVVIEADLTRPGDAAVLARACDGADAVVSCAGAPLAMRGAALRDRRRFEDVDRDGNLRLVREAAAAGAGRVVYVALHGGRALRHTAYAAAHEAVVDALAALPVPAVAVRPTGLFSFFDEVLLQARAGRAAVVGDGAALTNPVHEADVAAVIAGAADPATRIPASGVVELGVGGPEIYSRAAIVAMAFAALGRPAPRVRHIPPGLLRGAARLLRPAHPRLAALVEFGAAVSVVDAVAPAVGERDFAAHLAARAALTG